ncbi:hypothetical protein CRM22_005004 [Opisthorchis felineus]|nr:hypothetical protein CRM22_005004 [Opisthorchis felineus]TGZ67055.1 hypothetical protein CRM22_005004 [Opisthorchis felineus]
MAMDTLRSGKISPMLTTMNNGYNGQKSSQPFKPVKRGSTPIKNGPQAPVNKSDSTLKANLKQRRSRARYISVPTSPPAQGKHNIQSLNVGKYSIIRTLGRGNFAQVKLAIHLTTGREVAIKMIDKATLNESCRVKLAREVRVMKTLSHPNIVKLYEVIETTRHVYLVMEYAKNGEVFDHLLRIGRMPEKEAQKLFRQLFSAVEYCHQKNIVHRDLKAENLLFDENNNLKLADFGFANVFNTECHLDTFCGSPPYAAPELLSGQKYHGPEVDVWALGVILYMLVCGRLPFEAYTLKELHSKVLSGKYRIPFYMTENCEAMLRKMLIINPKKRATLRELLQEPWINTGYENDILQPYKEPSLDYNDPIRRAIMNELGFNPEDLTDAFENRRFNNVTATYLLLEDRETRHKLTNRLWNKCDKQNRTGKKYSDPDKSPEGQSASSDEEDMAAANVDGHERSSSAVVRSEQEQYTLHPLARSAWATGSLRNQDPVKKVKDFMQQPKGICDPALNLPKLIANSDQNGASDLKTETLTIDSLIERVPNSRGTDSNLTEKLNEDKQPPTPVKSNGLRRIFTSSLEPEECTGNESTAVIQKKQTPPVVISRIKTEPLPRRTFQPGDFRPATRTRSSRSIIIVSDARNGSEHDRLNYSKKPIRVISLIYPNDKKSEKPLSRSEGERFCTTENAESVSNVRKLSNPVMTYTSVLHRDLSNGIHRPEMSNNIRDDQRKVNQQPAKTNTILVAERHEPLEPVTSGSNISEKTLTASVKPKLLSPPVIVSRSPSSTDSTGRSQDFVTNVSLKMNVSDPWADRDRWARGIRRNPTESPTTGGADQNPEKRVISPIKQNSSQLWGMPRFADNRTNTKTRMTRSPPVTLKRTVLNGERSPDVRIVRKGTRMCTSTPTSPVFRTVEQPSRVFSIETPGQPNHAPRDGWSSLSQHDGPSGKHYGTQYTTHRIRPRRTPSAYESTTHQHLSIVYPNDKENGYSERCTPIPSGELPTRHRDSSPKLISRKDSGYTQGLEMKRPQSNLSRYPPVDKGDKYSYPPSVTSNMRIPIIPKYDQAGGNLRPTKINRESSTTPSGEGRTSTGGVKRSTSSNGEKITVPRKINWAFGINVQGDNSQALLRSLLRILEQKRIDYVYQNPYRLQCTYQPNSEMDQTPSRSSQPGPPIKWELEIVQLVRSKNYGVRFRYLSGDQSQYRTLEKSICSQFQRNSD